MNLHELEGDFADALSIVTSLTVAAFALAYTFLVGKKHGWTAAVRKVSFRCVAATIMRPNLGFRIGVAMVGIGFTFAAYYRWNGEHPPEPIRIICTTGMFLTVVATAGVAVMRTTVGHWRNMASIVVARARQPEPEKGVVLETLEARAC